MELTFEDWQAIWLTVWTAAVALVLILPPGMALAWLLARKQWRGKSIVETAVALPLVMPPVATGLILLKLFGRRGPIGGWLHEQFDVDIVFSWRAVVIALGVMAFPLLVRTLRTAFEEVPKRLEDIARTLGRSRSSVFLTITLPLARRGIAASLGCFGIRGGATNRIDHTGKDDGSDGREDQPGDLSPHGAEATLSREAALCKRSVYGFRPSSRATNGP